MTTTSGTAGTQQRYHTYGTTRSGGITATDYRYTGQFSDTVSGLIYMNARYYDPTIGQFISPDTIVPDPSNLFDYNRYMYTRGNPLKYRDPSGHCPAPPEGNENVICVAGFIPTAVSEGLPNGWIMYQADNRDFSSDSTGLSSRFYVWIDANTGQFIGDPKDGVHSTVQLYPPQSFLGGGEHQPRDSHNYFCAQKFDDGSIQFAYSVVCAGPGCLLAPGPEGEMYFVPNAEGSFDTIGRVEPFPNLEAYHWKNGKLANSALFRVQNFSNAELESGRASFWTGTNMYDWRGNAQDLNVSPIP